MQRYISSLRYWTLQCSACWALYGEALCTKIISTLGLKVYEWDLLCTAWRPRNTRFHDHHSQTSPKLSSHQPPRKKKVQPFSQGPTREAKKVLRKKGELQAGSSLSPQAHSGRSLVPPDRTRSRRRTASEAAPGRLGEATNNGS